MRYTAWADSQDGILWCVSDTQDTENTAMCAGLSETEAKVIAFALNQVADGRTLYAILAKGQHFEEQLYDGPTDL